MDHRKDRTELRNTLLKNGFTPLPNINKVCVLEGWPTVHVTEELIHTKDWSRSRWKDTGLRCGDLVAIDFDIDDEDLLNDFLDHAVETNLIDESQFVRIGRPPRELWLFITKDKISRRNTGKFLDKNGDMHQVEVLAHGSQIGAFGQHSDEHAYRWPEMSPETSHISEVPEISLNQAIALLDAATAFFEDRRLERHSDAAAQGDKYAKQYDLLPDMEVDTKDHGTLTVNELDDYLRSVPEGESVRCSMGFIRDGASNPTTGHASMVHGELCIADYAAYTVHYMQSADLDLMLSDIADTLKGSYEKAVKSGQLSDVAPVDMELEVGEKLDSAKLKALTRFAYVTSRDTVVDIARAGTAAHELTMAAFRNSLAPWQRVEEGPRGGDKVVKLADLWLATPDRRTVVDVVMRPDKPYPFFTDGTHEHYANTYRPVELPQESTGSARIGMEFLEHLLPDPAERSWFMQWLSFKLQHPDVRGPGVVMVAKDTFGTGRGSLAKLIRAMIGDRYVRNVNFKTIAGQTYQSQYNEWLVDSLMVVVNEAQEDEKPGSRWIARHNAYETLKDIIDPAEHNIEVMRKGGKNTQGRTYASVLIYTNHSDALCIPKDDRRLAVLKNGGTKPPSWWDRFHAWRKDPENIRALMLELLAVDLTGYNPFATPIETDAKREMMEANQSDMDRLFDMFENNCTGRFALANQFINFIATESENEDMDLPDDWDRIAKRVFIKKTFMAANDTRIKFGDKRYRVRALQAGKRATRVTAKGMRNEVLKNKFLGSLEINTDDAQDAR